MKRLFGMLLVLFLLVAWSVSADRNLVQEGMIEKTVLFFNPGGGMNFESWIGSGVIVSDDGYIITNRHVVGYYLKQGAKDPETGLYTYTLEGNSRRLQVYHADWGYGGCRIVAVSNDPNKDLAIVKIETIRDLPFAEIAVIKNMYPGDDVYSVGHPYGINWTLTKGVISNFLETEDHSKWILHDSSINPGNSGGPLYDKFGRVIGINFAAIPPFQAENMAVAVDARVVKAFIELAVAFDVERMGVMTEASFEKGWGIIRQNGYSYYPDRNLK